MGFKSLFKVRKPGHGETVENKLKSAIKAARAWKFPSFDNTRNSGGKKEVK